jgi:hypothetical protein
MNGVAAMHRWSAVMRAVVGCGVLRARRRAFAWKPRTGTGKRNHAGKDRPKQGQKDDGLIHFAFSPSLN